MPLTRLVLISAIGFFSLVAQTVLFREYLVSFAGNDLAVACFFGSWLFWVGIGALLGRAVCGMRVLRHFVLLALCLVPAVFVQHYLIFHARDLAGVAAYQVFPFARMLVVALLVCAPVPLCCGGLFTLGCAWAGREQADPGHVYAAEVLGAFVGGMGVTLGLVVGMSQETALLWSVFLFAAVGCGLGGLAWYGRRGIAESWPLFMAPFILGGILLDPGGQWTGRNRLAAWTRLLPERGFRGSFSTPKGIYVYGRLQGQWSVLAWGGSCEVFPGAEHAGRVVASHLAQKPDASRVLVIGSGSMGICAAFLRFAQVCKVTWVCHDPGYARRVLSRIPAPALQAASAAGRFDVPQVDARRYVMRAREKYDLIILNLPQSASLVMNRYLTREFFVHAKHVLAGAGILSLRMTGAENYLGYDLAYYGASLMATLKDVFARLALQPGEESWFFASDGGYPTSDPLELHRRFSGIREHAAMLPVAGLLALYQPERVQYQMAVYRRVAATASTGSMLNTDRFPRVMLRGLLLAARKAGIDTGGFSPGAGLSWFWFLGLSCVVYGVIRVIAGIREHGVRVAGSRADENDADQAFPAACGTAGGDGRNRSGLDSVMLVLCAGMVGMGLQILLMYRFQVKFGSLFLCVGLVSSLFMLGAFLGSWFVSRFLGKLRFEPRLLLPVIILLHLGLLGLTLGLSAQSSATDFGLCFLLCGVFTGVYFPLAAARLKRAKKSPATTGACLEFADHAGATVGAAMAGVLLVPLMGADRTIMLMGILMLVNLAAYVADAAVTGVSCGSGNGNEKKYIIAGYVLLGLGIIFMMFRGMIRTGDVPETGAADLPAMRVPVMPQFRDDAGVGGKAVAGSRTGAGRKADMVDEALEPVRRLRAAALKMIPGARLRLMRAELPGAGTVYYFAVMHKGKTASSFVFAPEMFTGEVRGYSGPIDLAVWVAADGVLRGFEVTRQRETPAYFRMLDGWREKLKGRNIFEKHALAHVDVVTGATCSSAAILALLRRGGREFAGLVLRHGPTAHPGAMGRLGRSLQKVLPAVPAPQGRPRNFDRKRVRTMLRDGRLSQHECGHYSR